MNTNVGHYLFGDEPNNYQYPGEKADKVRIQALRSHLIDLDIMWGDENDRQREGKSYDAELMNDVGVEIDRVRAKIDCLREVQALKKGVLEPEYLTDTQKEEIEWDMKGAALLTDARYIIDAWDMRKERRKSPNKNNRVHRAKVKKRTIERGKGRAEARKLKEAA